MAVAAKRRGCSGYTGVTSAQKWRNKLLAEWGSSEIRAASKRVASVAKLLGRLTENDCHCRRRRFCWTFRPLGNRAALHPEPARECDSAGCGGAAAGGAGAAGRRLAGVAGQPAGAMPTGRPRDETQAEWQSAGDCSPAFCRIRRAAESGADVDRCGAGGMRGLRLSPDDGRLCYSAGATKNALDDAP